jgi:hypothetical protein
MTRWWLFLPGLIVATALLHLVLIQPNHPGAMTWQALFLFPLELPVILFALLALPGRARLLRAGLAVILTTGAVLKVADYASFTAYGRSFNLATDLGLIDASWQLGSGAIGVSLALAAVALAVLTVVMVAALLWWATGRWVRLQPPGRLVPLWRGGFTVLTFLAGIVMVGQIAESKRKWQMPFDPPGAAFTARLAFDRVVLTRDTLQELAAFTRAAETDPFDGVTPLLDHIGGRDVLMIFVESYGRASFDNDLYAPTHAATLQAAEAALAEDPDIAMRSGWLTAPMIGGQSWLAHSSIASGLWISNQTRYRTLLASPRKTLFDLAREAGYHTATVVPAIVQDWPEGVRLGFETILAAADLGYEGLPFNWVTMPDQFTFSAYDRLLAQDRPDDRPLFTEIALISSHAPWVPVPDMIDWEDVGDGTVFNEVAQSDDPPDVVWRDRDRVRDQYRQAVDYALQAATGYTLRQTDDMPLVIILGDHQSANFVSGSDSFDVPIHVIGPREVLARIDDWGWTPGLVPDGDVAPWTMDLFRDRFLKAFSSGAPDALPMPPVRLTP